MPNFNIRSDETELIDDLALGNEALAQNLRELALTNLLLGGNQVTVEGLQKLLKNHKGEVKIADLGCGGGDMLLTMAKWFSKKHTFVPQLVGIDANAFMIDYAQIKTKQYDHISYLCQDIFAEDFAQNKFDLVTMTLFCHHFKETQLIGLLKNLKQQTRIGIVINDLHRHPLAYYAIWFIAKLLGASYLYQNDSKLSVLRAFSRADLSKILDHVGFEKYEIRWKWAFRWQVICYCS
jgi:2-polyprenyl-3-methyl-5-hydroxy-6-metoxy-1,4-benzoquinol methylase